VPDAIMYCVPGIGVPGIADAIMYCVPGIVGVPGIVVSPELCRNCVVYPELCSVFANCYRNRVRMYPIANHKSGTIAIIAGQIFLLR
jgi:hypothetical protein